MYLDPNLLPRVVGRRIVLTDDTISSGSTAAAVLRLFRRLDTEVAGLIFAMKQGDLWGTRLRAPDGAWEDRVRWTFETPLFRLDHDGWWPA